MIVSFLLLGSSVFSLSIVKWSDGGFEIQDNDDVGEIVREAGRIRFVRRGVGGEVWGRV